MSTRSRIRPARWFVLTLGLLLAAPYSALAQPGTAPTGDPGGFGIDGDLDPNAPSANTDWSSVIMNNGTPTSSSTLHGVDGFNSSDLAFSTTSSRLFANPNTDWDWDNTGMLNPLGGRDNFSNGVAHFSRDVSGHAWFTWAVDREGGGGQSYMDVGLYQSSIVRNGNGTFSAGGPHGGHTVGDVVLALELLDFVTEFPNLTAWRWTEITPGTYDFVSLTLPPGKVFTCANVGFQAIVPWGAFGAGFYQQERFAEASTDFSALLSGTPPTTFRTVLFESRFGPEIASVLRDFIEPISTSITTAVTPIVAGGGTRILGVTPNPSHGAVSVDFEIGRSAEITLEIFDLAGRRVASPSRSSLPAGRHRLRWEPGTRAPSGVYHARLVSDGRIDQRRFVIVP